MPPVKSYLSNQLVAGYNDFINRSSYCRSDILWPGRSGDAGRQNYAGQPQERVTPVFV